MRNISVNHRTGNRDKVLILDGSSYIGGHLLNELGAQRTLATYFRSPVPCGVFFDALTMNLSDLISDPTSFSHAVVLFAIPNPDACATNVETSYALNVKGVERVIDYLNEWGIKPIFTSTESVFDGAKGNYVESDQPNPVLTYGRQKVEVEEYLAGQCPRYAIVRLAKVFGSQMGDGTLFTAWLNQIKQSGPIYCAHDQVFSPIHVLDVARAIIRLIEVDCQGIYHLASPQAYSRLELINILISELSQHTPVEANVIPCSIHDFDLPEKRPLDVSMDPTLVMQSTGYRIKPVRETVREIVSKTSFTADVGPQ